MDDWGGGIRKRKIPPEFDLSPVFERRLREAPESIRNVVARGQGNQNCCVAFVAMNDHIFRGTWGNGSVRFLHCICKMLDGMPSSFGTTHLTCVRAEKGWWTCEEGLWPSNIGLSRTQFEDWKSIPQAAYEDAKKKRIRKNKAILHSRPSKAIDLGGQKYRLVMNSERRSFEKDKQIDILVIDSDFDTVAWAQVRTYVEHQKVVLEDLFVKLEVRRLGIGSELLRQIESLTSHDQVFRDADTEITVPIPNLDIRLPLPNTIVKTFYAKNGYSWNNGKIVPGVDYSVFTASKKLTCSQVPKRTWPITTIIRAWFVRHLRGALKREVIEGPHATYLRLVNSDFWYAWASIDF